MTSPVVTLTQAMRVLTVRQPWAWAIINGGKDVENRVRNIAGNYRGPVAIHAALNPNPGPWWAAVDPPFGSVSGDDFGAILGVVDLVDVHFGPFAETWDAKRETNARCSSWAETDSYHLVLANPRPLPVPIPFKGALGLRTLPDEVARAVLGEES